MKANPYGKPMLCILLAAALTGCAGRASSGTDAPVSSASKPEVIEHIDLSTLHPAKGAAPQYDNPIVYYTEDEQLEIIERATGYAVADWHILQLPKSVGHLSTFHKEPLRYESIGEYYRDFLTMYLHLEAYASPYQFTPETGGGLHVGYQEIEEDPDSDTVYTLLDGKQISVRDAVAFFEDYINTLPLPAQANLETKVMHVKAHMVDPQNQRYCLEYTAAPAFEGIPFDYHYASGTVGTAREGVEYANEWGYMACTDAVDSAGNFTRAAEISQRSDYTEFVPAEQALRSCKEAMTEQVGWELCTAELIYLTSNEKQSAPYFSYDVKPSYKFMLYNPNDDLLYTVYIDALTGKYDQYFKSTKNSLRVKVGIEEEAL